MFSLDNANNTTQSGEKTVTEMSPLSTFSASQEQTVRSSETVRIMVVGVGGAGGNVVSRMMRSNVPNIAYVNVNTDKPALDKSEAHIKKQIGAKLTNGRGAGSRAEVGKASAEESMSELVKVFDGIDLVFITAGMGGGTGTGAAPVIAEIAREKGALVVGVVTRPFNFEGNAKHRIADEGINTLRKKVDTLLVIPNEKLREVSATKITMLNAFAIADSVLQQALSGIAGVLRSTSFINLDFADLRTTLRDSGDAHMGVGFGTGKTKISDAAQSAISSPLMETDIYGAKRLLIQVVGSPDLLLDDIYEVVDQVERSAHPDANIIFGADFDDSLTDAMRVIIIATDFDGSALTDKASGARPKPPLVSTKHGVKQTPPPYEPPTFAVPTYTTQRQYGQTRYAPPPPPVTEEPPMDELDKEILGIKNKWGEIFEEFDNT